MSGRDSIAEAVEALGQMGWVLGASSRLGGLLEVTVIAQRASHELQRTLGVPLASVGIREGDLIAMRGSAGARTPEYARVRVPYGLGIGGKILVVNRPVSVADYERDPQISRDFANLVSHQEGLHGMAGVPIHFDGEIVGVLYAGTRNLGHIGDAALSVMSAMSTSLGPVVGTAQASETTLRLRIEEERDRIARNLHDSVGQLLFGIGMSARRLQGMLPGEAADLLAELKTIEAQTSEAASCLRDALRQLTPSPVDALPVVARMDVDAFTSRSGIAADCIVLGTPRELHAEEEATVLAVIRECLHNVEKHASATSVLLTIRYNHEVEIVIQDDGRGLPPDFVLDPVHGGLHGWGLTSLHQRVAALGGDLRLINNEDGGVTLRATIPTRQARGD